MKKTEAHTPEFIASLLDYDPETGVLLWKIRSDDMFPSERTAKSWNTRYAGKQIATTPCQWGYVDISILGVKHASHRVAWAIFYGEWPDGEIDHINRIPADNRISNLRVVSSTENSRNKGEYKNNTSGYRGVTFHKLTGKWMAQIKVNKRNVHLGLFDDPALAGAAYKAKAMEEFGRVE